MNLTENLNNSFVYARKLLSDGERLIILIILDVIPIVNWIVLGYAAHVLRDAPAAEAPPKLDNYGKLFVDGAKVSIASLIYMIVPLILILTGAVSMSAGVFGNETIGPVLGGFGVVLLLIGLVLAFILLIFLGGGMAHMVKTGKFGKAFAFGEILSIIRGIGWGKYLGWAVVTAIIALIIGGLTSSVPYVGWLLSAIISPFLSVFIFRSLGDLYNDGAPAELRISNISPAARTLAITCSSCGAQLQPHHKFCPVCGAPAPVLTSEGNKFCIACGARIPATAAFCGSCGAKQN